MIGATEICFACGCASRGCNVDVSYDPETEVYTVTHNKVTTHILGGSDDNARLYKWMEKFHPKESLYGSPIQKNQGERHISEDIMKTHPGFQIRCMKCGSWKVIIDNDINFSPTSGRWGSVDLYCMTCQATTVIAE